MLTISADLSLLSSNQREALSGFILTYPQIERRQASEPLPPDVIDRRKAAPEPEESRSAEEAFSSGPTLVVPQSTASNLDKSGLPWDERIHSSSKALTADGLWRKKRGVDDAKVAEVEGQLKQLMSLPTPAVAAVPAAAPTPIAVVPAPPAPQMNVAPSPTATVIDGRQAFVNLIGRVSSAIQAQKITQAEVLQECEKVGVPSLPLLANRLDLVPQVAMSVEAIIVSR